MKLTYKDKVQIYELRKQGLVNCLDYYLEQHALKVSWTAVCRTARTMVWGGLEISLYSIVQFELKKLEKENKILQEELALLKKFQVFLKPNQK